MEGMGLLGIGHITLQYMETIAVFKTSSEVIKSSTIGAASFSQSPYNACHLLIRESGADRHISQQNYNVITTHPHDLERKCLMRNSNSGLMVITTAFSWI